MRSSLYALQRTGGASSVSRFFSSKGSRTFTPTFTETPKKGLAVVNDESGSVPVAPTATRAEMRMYYPKPEKEEEKPKQKTGWGGSKFLIFITMNVVPMAGLLYAVKSASEELETETGLKLPQMPSEILEAATRAVRTSGPVTVNYIHGDRVRTTPVFPHLPEQRRFNIPDKPFIEGVKNSSLTDIFAAERSDFAMPFNFVHFGVSLDSPLAVSLDSSRKLTMVYTSPEEGLVVELEGEAVKVENKELQRHYFKPRWGKYIPPVQGQNAKEVPPYVLVKLIPTVIRVQHTEKARLAENDWDGVQVIRSSPTPDRLEWALPAKKS